MHKVCIGQKRFTGLYYEWISMLKVTSHTPHRTIPTMVYCGKKETIFRLTVILVSYLTTYRTWYILYTDQIGNPFGYQKYLQLFMCNHYFCV